MKTIVDLPILEGEKLEVEVKGFSSKSKVFLNGSWQREQSSDSGVYLIKLKSGSELKVIIEQDHLDFFPRVKVENEEFSLTQHSSLLSKIATFTPSIIGLLLYIFSNVSHAPIVFFAVATLYINSRVLRLKNKSTTKILTLGVTNTLGALMALIPALA